MLEILSRPVYILIIWSDLLANEKNFIDIISKYFKDVTNIFSGKNVDVLLIYSSDN